MGDKKSLAKARMELEELYLGIPDDSVNLTFQDLAEVKQNCNALDKKKSNVITTIEPIEEAKTPRQGSPAKTHRQVSPPKRLPSLDFSRGLEAAKTYHRHNYEHYLDDHASDHGRHTFDDHQSHRGHHGHDMEGMHGHHLYGNHDQHHHQQMHHGHGHALGGHSHAEFYDDVSVMSMGSMYQDRGGRPRRPGIPHSNICTVCSTYIYIFRHRCLVCGRVYCRNCVNIGMGEMAEGRKCTQCLGKRFSERYIQRAGKVGCCCSRYPSAVKQAELKWAEKGPRRSGERAYGRSTMMSRSRSPVTPRTPTRPLGHGSSNPPSFVMTSSPFSPYSSSHHHHLPL